MTVAYSYSRFSSRSQAKGDSLRRQLAAAIAYASIHDLTLDTTLQDHGVSGFSGANRTKGALKAFLERVERGEIQQGSYACMSHDLLSLDAIKDRVRSLADRLETPPIFMPTFGQSKQDGTPHIEVRATYDFVVCERGTEFERRSTLDLDELLYWIFEGIAFSIASRYELAHRRDGEDCRRQLFYKQVEILTSLSDRWGARRRREHDLILVDHPFVDR